MRFHTVDGPPPPPRPVPSPDQATLWDAASGRFHPVRLRAAIVARGWTVGEFAASAGVSRACLYTALGGRAVSDRTVIRIVSGLGARSPMALLDG